MTTTNTSWKKAALKIGLDSERALDLIKDNVSRLFGADYPLRIQVYQAFGTLEKVTLFGRILKCKAPEASDIDSIWSNLHAAFQRFETDEVPEALVSLSYGTLNESVCTDEEGYFSFELNTPSLKSSSTSEIIVHLSVIHEESTASTTTPVRLVNEEAKFGVISDIDDTIILTQASSLIRM
jgi:phosphatidate phosphatase APP1